MAMWPNGVVEKIAEVAADRLVVIREGAGVVRAEAFSRVLGEKK